MSVERVQLHGSLRTLGPCVFHPRTVLREGVLHDLDIIILTQTTRTYQSLIIVSPEGPGRMAGGEMSPHCYLVAGCSDKVSEPQPGGSCRVPLPLCSPFGVLLSNWGLAVRRSIRQKCIDPLAMTGHTGLNLISFLRTGWIAE